jgi:hypothetical protein
MSAALGAVKAGDPRLGARAALAGIGCPWSGEIPCITPGVFRDDGSLLVEDLQPDDAGVDTIIDGTWRPTFCVQQFMPWDMFQRYPQLKAELRRRPGADRHD